MSKTRSAAMQHHARSSTCFRALAGSVAWIMVFAVQAVAAANPTSNSSESDCLIQEIAGFDSPRGCILKKMRSSPFRVIYLDVQYIVQNDVAIAKMQSLGKQYAFWDTCDTAATAIPEWY
jgi:hypothetical protein